jgi:hypothetical protein
MKMTEPERLRRAYKQGYTDAQEDIGVVGNRFRRFFSLEKLANEYIEHCNKQEKKND